MQLLRTTDIFELNREQLETLYFDTVSELCNKANKHDFNLVPYNHKSVEKFRSFSTEEQHSALNKLKAYSKICGDTLNEGKEIQDSPSLLWHAIRALGLKPCSDLFLKIEKGDVIEIYSPDFKQAFRNFEFFKVSSYTFADMNLYEWRELYRRDDDITVQIAKIGTDLFSGKIDKTINSSVVRHVLEERFSAKKYKIKMVQKIFSPLFDDYGNVGGVVATSRTSIIKSPFEIDQ